MSKSKEIHPTIKRLESALNDLHIRRIDFLSEHGIESQKYNNWRMRGIPQVRMHDLAISIGVSYEYLRNGEVNDTSVALANKSTRQDRAHLIRENLPENITEPLGFNSFTTERVLQALSPNAGALINQLAILDKAGKLPPSLSDALMSVVTAATAAPPRTAQEKKQDHQDLKDKLKG